MCRYTVTPDEHFVATTGRVADEIGFLSHRRFA